MPSRPTSDASKALERQMRNWEIARTQRFGECKDVSGVCDFVTISRLVGSGGGGVARLIGKRLGWPVFDKEILQAMAEGAAERQKVYERVDERVVSWVEDTLSGMLQEEEPRDYFRRLQRTVIAIAQRGSAVFVGRGADLILPRDRGFRVRIVAPLEQCAAAFARQTGKTLTEATAEIDRIQNERKVYLEQHFHTSPNDPFRHDMVVNMAHFDIEQAAELVLTAMKLRGLPVKA